MEARTMAKSRVRWAHAARAALLATAMAVAAPASAELAEIAWSAEGTYDRAFSLAPGQLAEACGRLGRGEAVRWRWEADDSVNFNIHYHEGDKVEYPVQRTRVPGGEGTFEASGDRDYCWMWSNKTAATLSLRVRLSRLRPPG